MKIVSYKTCRVTSLFPFEEVIPVTGANDREIVGKLKDRYSFLKPPDLTLPNEEFAKNGYRFEGGQFKIGSEIARIADFSIFRDGIVINARKTEYAEAFLDDVIAYSQKEFSFRDFTTRPRRYFQSQVVVEFERSPAKLIQSLDKITSVISKRLQEIYEMEIPMKFSRLDFGFDKTMPGAPRTTVQPFIIERREGVSYEKERYFCAAPMRTNSHIEVLKEIESYLR